MKLTESMDNRGISPVIGIVLVIGITVGVGAIVGVGVLSTSAGFGDSTPNAEFQTQATTNGTIIITHMSGESVDPNRIAVNQYPGEDVFVDDDGSTYDEINAGDSGEIPGDETTTVNINWESKSGDAQTSVYSHTLTTAQLETLNSSDETNTPTESDTTTALTEGFESGTYTNTFIDDSQSSVSPAITDTYANTGTYSVDLQSVEGQTTSNRVTTKEAYSNISTISVALNKYRDDGEHNHWAIRLKSADNDREFSVHGDEYRNGIIVREYNKNGDQLYSTKIDSDFTTNEWKTVDMDVNGDSINITTDGNTAEIDTVTDWTTEGATLTLEANSWNNPANDVIRVAYDDVLIEQDNSTNTEQPTAASATEGFENKLYTDTFKDVSQSSVSPQVSNTAPYDGRYRLNLYSQPGSSTANKVITKDTYTNVTNVTTQLNKVNDGGDKNNWIVEFTDPNDQSRIQLTETSYNSGSPIAVQEVDENGNAVSQATLSTSEISTNTWTQVTIIPTADDVTIIVGDKSATLQTEKNWKTATTKVEFESNSWNGGSNMDVAIDNFVVKTDE